MLVGLCGAKTNPGPGAWEVWLARRIPFIQSPALGALDSFCFYYEIKWTQRHVFKKAGICSGKSSVAEFLVSRQGFTRLSLTGADDCGPTLAHERHLQRRSANNCYSFDNPEALINFATTHWQQRFVTTDVTSSAVLTCFRRRPFFLLVSIIAPVSVRWKRLNDRQTQPNEELFTLQEFVRRDDAHHYGDAGILSDVIQEADIALLNHGCTLQTLYDTLEKINLADDGRLRPGWDEYFMQLASLAASRSNCMKRRVGCVLVREKRVISTGYNGTPRNVKNCNEGGCARCNSGDAVGTNLSTCLCLHAEENALLEAGRERIGSGSILYCDTCPCLTCSVKITQMGISEVVYSRKYGMDENTAAVLEEGLVRLRQYSSPHKGVISVPDYGV